MESELAGVESVVAESGVEVSGVEVGTESGADLEPESGVGVSGVGVEVGAEESVVVGAELEPESGAGVLGVEVEAESVLVGVESEPGVVVGVESESEVLLRAASGPGVVVGAESAPEVLAEAELESEVESGLVVAVESGPAASGVGTGPEVGLVAVSELDAATLPGATSLHQSAKWNIITLIITWSRDRKQSHMTRGHTPL